MDIKKKKIAIAASAIFVSYLVINKTLDLMQPKIRSYCEKLLMDDQMSKFGDQVASIEVEEVKNLPMTKRINTIGRLKAKSIIELKTEIPSRIEDLPVSDGTQVEKGSILIQLDERETLAKLKSEKVQYEFKKSEYERMKTLHGQNFESKKKMEEAKAGMEISEARIEELEVTLSKLKLTAPFDGTMGIIEVSKGAYVQPNQVLGSFVDNSFMHIDFKIPEKFINDVGAGQVVEVTLNSLDQVFEGTVEAVEPKSESESHSVKIRAGMENYQNLLRHGMFCSISLIIGEKSNALSIEEHAVEVEGEAEYVWVIEKGKAMKRRVMTGSKEKGRVEILAGLEAGELVVIAGQLKLYPGSKVKITNLSAEEGQKNKEEKEHEKPIEKISKKFKVKRKGQKK